MGAVFVYLLYLPPAAQVCFSQGESREGRGLRREDSALAPSRKLANGTVRTVPYGENRKYVSSADDTMRALSKLEANGSKLYHTT